ncbi:MAG TPA: RluA family pseudouridine synthase, partial [Candidatus Eremiobacteraceae bacterium]|nr:RluA family pseudouridine synthase [Candidatus Eremiobacteraceae bacterium]
LDKGTSGLIVVAKTEAAMRRLSAAIAKREVRREYDAIVWGAPAATSGTIEAPIGRHPTERTRFAVSAAGRAAVTHYRVRERFALHGEDVPSRAPRGRKSSSSSSSSSERLSLLDLRLETGRTHQIRVHCAAIGHPIAGDAAYGPGMPKLGAGRPMLHAARLRFTHPVTGKPLTFEAPWPDDFRELVERLRSGGAS